MGKKNRSDKKPLIQSLERALDILGAVGDSAVPLRAVDAAQTTGIGKNTAHNLLRALLPLFGSLLERVQRSGVHEDFVWDALFGQGQAYGRGGSHKGFGWVYFADFIWLSEELTWNSALLFAINDHV